MDSTSYPKAAGTAGSKGTDFQLNLVSMFLLNALRQNLLNWRLSTENKLAGKFDDVVFELSDGSTILLQAKHKENKKITKEQLLSTNAKREDFSLPKYFLSYLEISDSFAIKLLILCTNTQADETISELLNKNSVTKESMLHYKDGVSFYTFNDTIVTELITNAKEYNKINLKGKGVNEIMISEENAKKFLKHIQFYLEYPSGSDLEKWIDTLLSNRSVSKLQEGISYLFLHQKMKDWFKHPKGEYLTESRTKAIFCEIHSEKYVDFLKGYNVTFKNQSFKEMIEGSEKRMFHVIAEEGLLLPLLKVYYNLNQSKNQVLYVGYGYSRHVQLETIKSFQLPRYNFLIIGFQQILVEPAIGEICSVLKVILENRKYKKIIFVTERNNKLVQKMKSINESEYYVFDDVLTLEDLSEDTQEMFMQKSVIFQGESMKLGELLLDQITDELKRFIKSDILEKLLTTEDIKIGRKVGDDLEEELPINYLNRTFEGMVESEEYDENWKKKTTTRKEIISEKNFCDIKNKMVLISDSAGMGKTTVLKSLALNLKKTNPGLWIVRVELNRCTHILKESLSNKRHVHVLDLLIYNNFNQLLNTLENFLFSLKEKVILMFDGVDEICPDYTQLILNLIVETQKDENLKQVFVTTRPHMAEEMEKHLEVTSFKLIPFTEENQIGFLTRYWSYFLKIDSANISKCEKYARILIRKVSFWIKDWYDEYAFVASPLHVKILAEVFLQSNELEDWEGCMEYIRSNEDEPKLPEMMNIVNLYKKFVEKKRDIFIDKGNPKGNTISNQAIMDQFEECLVYHRLLAMKDIFGEREDLSFFSYSKYDAKQDFDIIVLKMGIVQKLHNQLIFVHRTFAEYFAAESIFKELQLQNPDIRFQRFLIDEIFIFSHYHVIRKYLNCFLYNQTPYLSYDIFKNYMSLVKNTDNSNLLHLLVEENNYDIIRLVLKAINFEFFPKNSIDAFFVRFKRKPRNTLSIIKCEGGINIKYDDLTLLNRVLVRDNFEAVNFLCEMGVDVNCKFHYVSHPDIWKYCHRDINRSRAYYNYSYVFRRKKRISPLQLSVALNWPHTVRILLKHGADTNFADNDGDTAFHIAAKNNDVDTLLLLLNNGANIACTNKQGKTALHYAADVENYNTVEFLLRHSVIIIDNIDVKCNTALHHACYRDYLNITKILVRHGCNINIANNKGNTALHFAVTSNCKIVNFLIEHGAIVNVCNKKGDTPLHLAVRLGFIDSINALLRRDVGDINVVNEKSYSSLHVPADIHHSSIVSPLIEGGVNMNIANNRGCTPLHLAARRGNSNVVDALLGYSGVDINVVDKKGNTALHLAINPIFFDRSDIISKFIKVGANTNIANKKGNTALHLAARWGCINTVSVLMGHSGTDINIVNDKRNTALHVAIENNHYDVIFKLIEGGADVNIANKKGLTPQDGIHRRVYGDSVANIINEAKSDDSSDSREGLSSFLNSEC